MKLILIGIGIMLLTGCINTATKGLAQVDYTFTKQGNNHYHAIVQSPNDAKTPGKIKIQGNTLTVETGIGYRSEGLALQHLPYWGLGLIVLGVIILGLRRVLFFMPSWLGLSMSGVGVGVVILPELINRYLGISYLVFVFGIILFIGYWLYRHRLDALTKNQLIQGIAGIKTQDPLTYEKIKPILSQYQDASVKTEIAKTKADFLSRL